MFGGSQKYSVLTLLLAPEDLFPTKLRVVIITSKIGLRYCNQSKCALIRFLTRFFLRIHVFISKRGSNSEDTNRCRNICGKNGEWRSIAEERRIIFKEPEGGMGKMTTERRVKRVVSILLPGRWKTFFLTYETVF